MEVIQQDRREDRRYPIELQMRYKLVLRSRSTLTGSGRTLNLSSGGILFASDQSLPSGALMEISVEWPVLLQDRCALTLLIVGRVVRCQHKLVAVKMNRYEFLTRPRTVPGIGFENPGQTYVV